MLTQERGYPLLDSRRVTVKVKNQLGQIVVPPLDPFWLCFVARVRKENWRGKDADLIIPGTPYEFDLLGRQIGQWMSGHGWNTVKKSHALRAYCGSLIAMKEGIWKASQWLRHASVKVTQQHYTHYLNSRVFRSSDVRIRWGRKIL